MNNENVDFAPFAIKPFQMIVQRTANLRDMIKEAQFFTVLSHANILSLRGILAHMDAETLGQRFNRWRVGKT